MKIEIFGRENCQYCVYAKNECFKYKVEYTYKDVQVDLTDDEFKDLLTTRAVGARTLPIVIVDDVWIGGYSELRRLLFQQQNDKGQIRFDLIS